MKIIFTIFCAIIVSSANGQDSLQSTSDREKIQFLVSNYSSVLRLSHAQKNAFTKLVEARSTEINKADVKRTHIDYETINTKYREKLRAILDDEQYQAYTHLVQKKQKDKAQYKRENPGYRFSQEDKELDF